MQEFHVGQDGTLIIAVPGMAMAPDQHDAATEIELRILRANPAPKSIGGDLPEPLADPLQESGSPRRPRRAYVVKAGEYIQIIDVSRPADDGLPVLLAARKLDKGIENALDATVTRTLTGRAYPTPGLPSKAFGFDFEPLVEMMQDTVGRHDAFATACNPRYYDDVGYPGHANCTDNFNAALEPYGIAKRKGWEAINFFYNTRIDA